MSPWPGGHHSRSGCAGQDAGPMVAASTLGDMFCSSSMCGSCSRSACAVARKARVSSDVEKEFMRMNATLEPYVARMCFTCSAIRSRNVLPSFTTNSDLAFSRPMLVPRPPFSFSTAVADSRPFREAWSGSGMSVSLGSSATASMSDSGTIPVAPPASCSKLCLNAEMAASDKPCALHFAWKGANFSSRLIVISYVLATGTQRAWRTFTAFRTE
mmetsp:Transcript_14726/g.36717  ORF Transcript_14726/g.36717 Transcript_14726/m.36717 type:complete len:214 (+) Transcript_14726:1113-1754(+)